MAKQVQKESPGTVPVRMDLPEADHKRLRVAAATVGLSMAEFSRRAVADRVKSVLDEGKK